MKKIFKHFGVFLSVALMGAFTACNILDPASELTEGLGIKVFFPTKVVAGQPMTINGTGFTGVREIVFPDGVSVTDFEIVSNDMIRVTAPAGIAASGGKILVRTLDEEAESRLPLTVGKTVVSGFSKQEGEEIEGGEQLTIYGQDLEFISKVELLDEDGNPIIIDELGFYRKGDGMVIITIPKKVFDGTFVGKVYTYDGREFLLPELTYKPASDGGHWETKKVSVWKNEDGSAVSWSGTYRFAGEGHSTGEEIYTFPADVWEKLKSTTFYLDVQATDPQVRVTTGWWSTNLTADDIQPGNELITDNGDGTWTVKVDLASAPDLLAAIDDQHLLFTGDRFTPVEIYFLEEEWVDGGEGHMEIVKTFIWENEDGSAVSWSGTYRFAGEGHSTGEEIYTIPADIWEKMKSTTFYLDVQATDPQVRVTTGWWSTNLTADDIQPGNELITDNGDGTWTVKVDLASAPDLLAAIDDQHLLFTGDRFTPIAIYFAEEVWVGGGGEPKEVELWKNEDGSAVSWSGTYRFAGEGHSTGEEIYTFPADIWEKMKSTTFYLDVQATDPQVRVTTGWWSTNLTADDIQPGNELITDNGDGTWTVKVDLASAPDLLAAIDDQHLLFTGDRFTPLKLYFLE